MPLRILLEEEIGQSFDMLTSQSDILFWVHGDIKHGDALLDADANLKGVGRQLLHGDFDGSSTASVVFRQSCKIIVHILTDSMVKSLEHKLRDHVIRQLVRCREQRLAKVLPVEDSFLRDM
jgi:hypothetical protein